MSSISKPDAIRLRHMLDAAKKASTFLEGHERADLESDEMLSLAIVRLIEIIGEAAAHVSDSVQETYPQIPWKQISGTRNRLIHGYFDVDLDVVWAIVQDDLPVLIEFIESVVPTSTLSDSDQTD